MSALDSRPSESTKFYRVDLHREANPCCTVASIGIHPRSHQISNQKLRRKKILQEFYFFRSYDAPRFCLIDASSGPVGWATDKMGGGFRAAQRGFSGSSL